MKKTFFLLITTLAFFASCKTQDPAVTAANAAQQQWEYEKAVDAIKERAFVLEANRIDFKRGRFTYVTPNTNFLMVDGNKATIQLAFNSPYAGPNGIGGLTLDGTISGISMETTKKGRITYQMSVQGAAGSAVVRLSMFEGSNRCSATVSSNFTSNEVTFTGLVYPKEESNVYKGRSF